MVPWVISYFLLKPSSEIENSTKLTSKYAVVVKKFMFDLSRWLNPLFGGKMETPRAEMVDFELLPLWCSRAFLLCSIYNYLGHKFGTPLTTGSWSNPLLPWGTSILDNNTSSISDTVSLRFRVMNTQPSSSSSRIRYTSKNRGARTFSSSITVTDG